MTLIVLGLLALLVVILLAMAINIVKEYERLVVFRLGRVIGALEPGLRILIPGIDKGVKVDLREIYFDVPPQTAITEDNAHLSIDFLVYMKIVDALPSVLAVEDFKGAARGIAITTLRAVVGEMALDDVLAQRERINEALRGKLDEVTNRWGIKVTAVEIREVVPPREIQEAMTRQMSAERSRRATVTEADGQREAAVRQAEGEKRAIVLRAEGDRQGTIERAEGDRQAAVLRAQGQAEALQRIYQVAQGLDSNTMSLQYLDTLQGLGDTEATKFIVPIEFTNLVRPFTGHTGESNR